MSVLEERYRSLLRLLPSSYRDVWEEDMVATFLQTMAREDPDEAEYVADFGRPSLPEVASIVSLAARLRLGGPGAPPQAYAWGEAVRLFALVGLLANGVIVSAEIVMSLWVAGRSPLPAGRFPSPWDNVLMVTGLAWVGAYAALVIGHRRPARMLAGLALIPFLLVTIWRTSAWAAGREPEPLLLTAWCVVLLNAVVVAALAAFHREAPPVTPRPWVIAGAVGMALVPVLATLTLAQDFKRGLLLDWPGLCCLAVVAAVVVLVRRGGPTPWTMALSLLAAVALVLRVVSLLDSSWHGPARSLAMALGVVETTAVLCAGAWVAAVSSRAMRKLPRPV